MEYKFKDLGTYKLHLIKTNKFKTIKVRVSFRSPIKKQEITLRNILFEMLTYSSYQYKTKRDMIIKTQDLYAASIKSTTTRVGNYSISDIDLTVLNDSYTEEGNFLNALEFLKDIVYNPNVEDNKFDEEILSILKDNNLSSLEGIKENPSYYSLLRFNEEMNDDGPISYRMCGYIEDLEKINGNTLYEYYKKVISKDLMDIFVIGNIDFDSIEDLIRDNFALKTFKKQRLGYYLPDVKARARKKYVNEQTNNSQSKLIIGCRMYGLSQYERNYPLTLYNIILGAGSDSKLFREVREKNSLCYSINSIPNKLDNVLLLRAGVDSKNIKKAEVIAEDQLYLMKKGKFSEDDIKIAKEYFQTALDSTLENQSTIIDAYYMISLLGLDDFETRRKKMNEVKKSDIIKVAKKIKVDTIYCLEGNKND